MKIQNYQGSALTSIVEANKENEMKLTGEKNLKIEKDDLIKKVCEYNKDYLEVMEMEAQIFVRQGLWKGYFDDENMKIMFDIPDWDRFISAVNAFYKACYAPSCDEY